ncbi:MAG TPA: alpha/beta family hydrolase, partial [Phenylobacterium sp.]|uniref:alpha/beta family hydrolase n=1 Tax=Phenylobacterium sp. TaxID=1871053 RepID=UPI002B469BE6
MRPARVVYDRPMQAQDVTIPIGDADPVSGLWQAPDAARACLVLAHGAGAGMTHRSMSAIADGLAGLGVASLRYQFPYMQRDSRRPDPPAVAQAAVRAAAAA